MDATEAVITDALEGLAVNGFHVVPGVLDGATVAQLRTLILDGIAADEAIDRSLVSGTFDPDDRNRRLWRLPLRHRAFRDLAEHPLALAIAERFLGPSIFQESILLQNLSANITLPGSGEMGLHADLGFITPPWPETPVMLQIAWAIDPYYEENGATRFVRGSHLLARNADPDAHWDAFAEGPAGSLILWDARTWHQTGRNSTADARRIGIIGGYTQPWVRTQLDWGTLFTPELRADLTPRMVRLLGLTAQSVGYVDVHRVLAER